MNVYYTLLTFDDIKVRKKGSIDKSIVKAGKLYTEAQINNIIIRLAR